MQKLKFAWATQNFEKARFVLVGVPDESGSHSYRKGSSKAPDKIRKVSNERYVFKRNKKISLIQPQYGKFENNLHDYGNIKRKDISGTIEKIIKNEKIPVIIGGDHSITYEALEAINKDKKDISLIYFDAHPDIISSSKGYYGSVVCDLNSLKNLKLNKSVEIGIRATEGEELQNIKDLKLKIITPLDLTEKGVFKILKEIKKKLTKNAYLSIDMDSLDPAFTPGVSTPVPGGITAAQFFYLITEVSKLNIIGIDITEVTPRYDINDATSDFAAKTIIEIIARK